MRSYADYLRAALLVILLLASSSSGLAQSQPPLELEETEEKIALEEAQPTAVSLPVAEQPAEDGQEQETPSPPPAPAPAASLGTPLEISLGALRTDLEAATIQVLVKYLEGLPDIFLTGYKPGEETGWLLDLSPEVSIQTGEQDAFNGVIAKISGNFLKFYTTTEIPGDDGETIQLPGPTPDSRRLFHALPLSLGFESDNRFERINGLVEFGYVPFHLGDRFLKLGLNPKVGVFLQGGYKFDNGGDDTMEIEGEDSEMIRNGMAGGGADESSEELEDPILRLKTAVAFKSNDLFTLSRTGSQGVRLLLDLVGWWDIANDDFYHKVDVTLRLELIPNRFFDLKYEDGSGAPNFNTGDQFSANLTMAF